jgi:hypothetical protein
LETGILTKEEIRIISLDQNLVLDGMEIRKPRQTIPVKNLNIKNLVSPGRVFGENLMGLVQDSLVFNGTEQIVEDLRFTESNSLKATIARFQEFLTKDSTTRGMLILPTNHSSRICTVLAGSTASRPRIFKKS